MLDIADIGAGNTKFFRKFGLRQSAIFPIRANIIRWRNAIFKLLVLKTFKDAFNVFVGFVRFHCKFFTKLVTKNTKNRRRDKATHTQISTGRFLDCQTDAKTVSLIKSMNYSHAERVILSSPNPIRLASKVSKLQRKNFLVTLITEIAVTRTLFKIDSYRVSSYYRERCG